MKKTVVLGIGLLTALLSRAQDDSTGYAGDNFDLETTLELFKKANTLEEFEQLLNTESNYANNLDLNGDGETDYIMVSDQMDESSHAIQLQVAVSETETQDVATILIEQKGSEEANLQIVGDEDLYGEEKVVEPYEEEADAPKGPSYFTAPVRVIVVNVWGWPTVRHIYRPGYVVYRSPYRWRVYPVWWRPWHPVAWHMHHRRVVVYHVHYHHVKVCHLNHAHGVWVKHKSSSASVKQQTQAVNQAKSSGKTASKANNQTKTSGKTAGKATNETKSANTNQKSSATHEKGAQKKAGQTKSTQQKSAGNRGQASGHQGGSRGNGGGKPSGNHGGGKRH